MSPATPALLEDLTGTVTRDASYANAAVWVSTHSADPGSSGANELTTGSGADGRQQPTFASGGSGSDSSTATITIDIPSAQTIPWYGIWTAQTGGTFLGGFPAVAGYLIASALASSPTITCPAHGLANGDVVRLFTAPNAQSVIPTGLSGDPTTYYVVGATSDTLELSATMSGSPITPTGSGGFFLALDQTLVFTGTGVLSFTTGNIVYETVS
jgi:hypothetical protein